VQVQKQEIKKSKGKRKYAHLHRYNFRRAGQQGPTRTLTAALKRSINQLLGRPTHSIIQVEYYKREN